MNLLGVKFLVHILLLLANKEILCQMVVLLSRHSADAQLLVQEIFCCQDTAVKGQIGAQTCKRILSDGHSTWD